MKEDITSEKDDEKKIESEVKKEEYVKSDVSHDDDNKSGNKEEGKNDELSENVEIAKSDGNGALAEVIRNDEDNPTGLTETGNENYTDVEKPKKHVHFDIMEDDENEKLFENFKIEVSVADIVNRVILMNADEENTEKHTIDEFYVQFPSSQTRAPEIIQKLSEKEEKKNTYKPDIEDITDDEEENKKSDGTSSVINDDVKEVGMDCDVRKIDADTKEEVKNDEEKGEEISDEVHDEGKDVVEDKIRKNSQVEEVKEGEGEKDKTSKEEKEEKIRKIVLDKNGLDLDNQIVLQKNKVDNKEKNGEDNNIKNKERKEDEDTEKKEKEEIVDTHQEDSSSKEEDTKIRKNELEKKEVENEEANNEKEKQEKETNIKKEEDICKDEEEEVNQENNCEIPQKKVESEGEGVDTEDVIVREVEDIDIEDKKQELGVDGQIDIETEHQEEENTVDSSDGNVRTKDGDTMIRKMDKDAITDEELVYVESGSDFEENLIEKWKDFEKGKRLKR